MTPEIAIDGQDTGNSLLAGACYSPWRITAMESCRRSVRLAFLELTEQRRYAAIAKEYETRFAEPLAQWRCFELIFKAGPNGVKSQQCLQRFQIPSVIRTAIRYRAGMPDSWPAVEEKRYISYKIAALYPGLRNAAQAYFVRLPLEDAEAEQINKHLAGALHLMPSRI
jgi:hypothetical protein